MVCFLLISQDSQDSEVDHLWCTDIQVWCNTRQDREERASVVIRVPGGCHKLPVVEDKNMLEMPVLAPVHQPCACEIVLLVVF